jgi:dienelactone hydrolase
MPSKRSALDPLAMIEALYDRQSRTCAFGAKDRRAAVTWQKRTRAAVAKLVGFLDQEVVPPAPKVVQTVDRGSYIRRKVIIRTTPWSIMPMYLLTPKGHSTPRPCVLALAGHGYGVKDIVGLWEDGSERRGADGYHQDFGCALAQRGFVVLAPEISCFGERQADYSNLGPSPRPPSTCYSVAHMASMLGHSALGLRLWDAMRAVDYLDTCAEVDLGRLGVMGISGGGMHAFFSMALDTRIAAGVISGYFCQWQSSLLAIHHCPCMFVPGLMKLGELSDLAGLLAPRPVLVEAGTHDEIFPLPGVKEAVRQAGRAWEVLGAPGALQTDYFEGRHRISGAKAYDFLTGQLG